MLLSGINARVALLPQNTKSRFSLSGTVSGKDQANKDLYIIASSYTASVHVAFCSCWA